MKQLLVEHKAYFSLLALLIAVCVYLSSHFENEKIWGDEGHYISMAHKLPLTTGGVPKLLPGAMTYDLWPPFSFAFYSLLSTETLKVYYQSHNNPPSNTLGSERQKFSYTLDREHQKFLKRVSVANTMLLALASAAVYIIALIMGLTRGWGTAAATLTVLNPRMLFYQQALWPEILHLALLTNAILFFLLFLRQKKYPWLIVSSVLFSYCVLTKGVAGIYILLLAPLLIYQVRGSSSLRPAFIALLMFLGPFLVLTNAQKLKNFIFYDDYAISSNTWINIEAGLILHHYAKAEGYENVYDRYWQVADNPRERENLSRARVITFIKAQPLGSIISNQLRNYSKLLNQSFLARGIREQRWRNTHELAGLENVSIMLSWLLFTLGLAGLLRYLFHNPYTTVVAVFLVYYLSAMIIVGFNSRFFIQAIPFLAIFAALVLNQSFAFLSRKHRAAS